MQFNVTYTANVNNLSQPLQMEFKAAVNAALQFYEHAYTNNVTVNITFDWASLGKGVVAENSFYYNTYSYSTIVNALKATQKSADDIAAYTTLPVTDPSGGSGNDYALTSGQAKALGLSFSARYDDFVTLNSDFGMNGYTFDPNNRAVSGEYDAIGALEHEISEGVFGRIGSLGSASAGLGAGIYTPLDLFRYSSSGVRDMNHPGANDYFSVDGTHLLTEFNNHNQFGGDVSDWYPNIQGDSFGDAYQGTVGQVTATDLRELDVLGWNRARASASDFVGNDVGDILWRNTSTGEVDTWLLNNGQVSGTTVVGSVSSAWQFAGAGDFNGDYTSDMLWRNMTTGAVESWLISNGKISGGTGVGSVSSAWQPLGTGDFNADGTSDVLWLNTNTGEVDTWLITNGHLSGGTGVSSVSSAWQFAGIGDFNGDGTSDVLWLNKNTGEVDTWLITNGHITGGTAIGSISNTWQSLGTGDFNGDGTSDILWRNTATGEVDDWLMQNGRVIGTNDLGTMSTAWKCGGIGYYNGDGTCDILWQNTSTGAVNLWQLANGQVTGSHSLGTVSTALQAQPITYT
jgi:hypothetical protein